MRAGVGVGDHAYPSGALFVESPWYGVLEVVDEPDSFRTKVWDGKHVCEVVAETLRPLTREAAAMLGVRFGDRVWDEAKKAAWEAEPLASFYDPRVRLY